MGALDKFYFVGFLFNFGSAALLALFFTIWWWTNRRIPLRGRQLAFLLVVGVAVIVGPFCHPSVGLWGILLMALPVVLTAAVLWTIVARKLPPWVHRPGLVAVVAIAFAYFTLVRVDGLDSNLRSDVHWRWNPSAEDRFLAEQNQGTNSATEPQASSDATQTVSVRTGDWAEFRGPDRQGVVKGVRIATDWAAHPPRLLWRHRLGPAWSSVITVGGRLYTQEQRGDQEAVVCYDADTGRQLWAREDRARFWETVSGAGPRATPTFRNGRIYSLGGTGILNCLDAATGERKWSRDIAADAQARPPQWGFSGSPLVVDDLVVVFAGGDSDKNLLAYRAITGKPAWSAPAGQGSYSSPQLATLAGQRQCQMLTHQGLTSVTLSTGAILWKGGAAMPGAPRTVQPQAVGASQLLVGTYDGASITLLDVRRDGDAWKTVPRWTSKNLRPEFPDFVVHEGHAYGFDVNIFCCVDLASGKRCWKEGRYGRGQVILLADQGLLVVISETGEAVLLSADPERQHELGRFQALEGKTWNHPVIAHGRLFARNAEEIACYDLAQAASR
jgi:outer membrane protein assembly factor BamB